MHGSREEQELEYSSHSKYSLDLGAGMPSYGFIQSIPVLVGLIQHFIDDI